MQSTASLLLLAALGTATAIPAPPQLPVPIQPMICGQYDKASAGDYVLSNNQWGLQNKGNGPTEHQCAQIVSQTGDHIYWNTSFIWEGAVLVKSFTNMERNFERRPASQISRIPTNWSWNVFLQEDVMANVAYDMFLGTDGNEFGTHQYEVMVWLGRWDNHHGIRPLSDTGAPIATVNIGGLDWLLWMGHNDGFTGYTFEVPNETRTNFQGDLRLFLHELFENHGVDRNLIVQAIQAGSEAWLCSDCALTTTDYFMNVEYLP